METSVVELQFPFTFTDRLRAGLAVTAACLGCLAWTLAFPAAGIALPIVSYVVGSHFSIADALFSAFLVAFMPSMIMWNTWTAHKAFTDTPAHTYTINSEGVRSRSAHTEVMQDWSVIRRVQVKSGFLMLFFTKQCAHCIPLRYLDQAQLNYVVALAKAGQVRRVDV
jgi:hypothetical protein